MFLLIVRSVYYTILRLVSLSYCCHVFRPIHLVLLFFLLTFPTFFGLILPLLVSLLMSYTVHDFYLMLFLFF